MGHPSFWLDHLRFEIEYKINFLRTHLHLRIAYLSLIIAVAAVFVFLFLFFFSELVKGLFLCHLSSEANFS